jgi:hypothetical protein
MSKSKTLARNVIVGGTLYAAGDTPPKDVADQITNPNAWAGDEDSDGGKGYGDMSPEDLKAEAEKRELTVTGTGANGNVKKSDLVAALEAHDAASA